MIALLACVLTAPSDARQRLSSARVYQDLPVYKAREPLEPNPDAYYSAMLRTADNELTRVHDVLTEWLRVTHKTSTADQIVKQHGEWKSAAAAMCDSQADLFKGGTMMGTLRVRCTLCQTRLRTVALEQFLEVVFPENEEARRAERAAWRRTQPPLCDE